MSEAFDGIYSPCTEANPADDVPQGNVVSLKGWQVSTVYPQTVRDIRFYRSAGVVPGQSNLMLAIFNDGIAYLGRNGPVRASAVLDSLVASGDIGPVLAIFIDPGRPAGISALSENQEDLNALDNQRSIEYDSLRPDYGRFLLNEVIPLAEKHMNCRASSETSHRLIAGMSSGGIGAFTAAWHYPESFGRVLSHCGSFTNIKGGHHYPWMIRNTPRKPIRVFMQSGANDIDGLFGNWPLANQSVASALAFAGYDYRFEFGEGGHTLAHGGSLFADSLRWLFRQE